MIYKLYLPIVRYDQTVIRSGVAKIWSLHEEGVSEPNTQTIDIKSWDKGRESSYDLWPENVYVSRLLYHFCVYRFETFQLKYKKRLLLRCIHHFKSDLINNMDHMRILGIEPSSVILSLLKLFEFSRHNECVGRRKGR